MSPIDCYIHRVHIHRFQEPKPCINVSEVQKYTGQIPLKDLEMTRYLLEGATVLVK